MTNQTPPEATPGTLRFADAHTVRIVMIDGCPHFALADLCAALGYNHHAAACVNSLNFPEHAKRVCEEPTEEGPRDTWALSPVGVWLWTHQVDAGKGQSLAAWARREALRLFPDASPDDPAMFLQMNSEGTMPPRPMRYSGRAREWKDLRYSPAYEEAQQKRRAHRLSVERNILAAAQQAYEASAAA